MMETSTCLMVTAGWLMPSTHDASHGAGHRRPVHSGKLFVAWRRSIASSPLSRQTRAFHSGMRLPSGQPWWQNGTPQSMQRPAWLFRPPFSWASYTSFQSMIRTGTGRRGCVSRCRTFRNPRGSATGYLQDSRPYFFAVRVKALFDGVETGLQDCGVVARQYFGDAGGGVVEVLEQTAGQDGFGFFGVLGEQAVDDVAVLGVQLKELKLSGVQRILLDALMLQVKHV